VKNEVGLRRRHGTAEPATDRLTRELLTAENRMQYDSSHSVSKMTQSAGKRSRKATNRASEVSLVFNLLVIPITGLITIQTSG
jgi:hypothetical protein